MRHALCTGPFADHGAPPATGRVPPCLEVRAGDKYPAGAVTQGFRRGCRCGRAARKRWQHNNGRIFIWRPRSDAPRSSTHLAKGRGAPALSGRHALHSSGVHHLALRVDAAYVAPPATAEPNALRPTGLEQDVGVGAGFRPEEHHLAELQRLLAARLAEEPLVGRAAVRPLQVLGARVAHELGQPSQHGVVAREAYPHLPLQGAEVHAHETLRDLHGVLCHPVGRGLAGGGRDRDCPFRQLLHDRGPQRLNGGLAVALDQYAAAVAQVEHAVHGLQHRVLAGGALLWHHPGAEGPGPPVPHHEQRDDLSFALAPHEGVVEAHLGDLERVGPYVLVGDIVAAPFDAVLAPRTVRQMRRSVRCNHRRRRCARVAGWAGCSRLFCRVHLLHHAVLHFQLFDSAWRPALSRSPPRDSFFFVVIRGP